MKKEWCLIHFLNSNWVDKCVKKNNNWQNWIRSERKSWQLTKINLFMFKERKREEMRKGVIHMWAKIWSECNEECEF